jgi:ATP-dependent DNA helicase RecG
MFFTKTPIKYLKWVGSSRLRDLEKQDIRNVEDLLYYAPFKYEDRRHSVQINKIVPGENCAVLGRIKSTKFRRIKGGMTICEIIVEGEGGYLKAVWFNQPYLRQVFKNTIMIWLFGKADYGKYGAGLQMNSPDYEIIDTEDTISIHSGRIVPIYKQIKNTSSKMLRRIIFNALFEKEVEIPEILPSSIIRKRDLIDRSEAFKRIHFPLNKTDVSSLEGRRSPMHYRLIYEEFMIVQSALYLIRSKRKLDAGIKYNITDQMEMKLFSLSPFRLTAAQQRVMREILNDMRASYPMNRLLQGDVGSGKTIVAILACFVAISCGYQVAFMAPTEILAEQHYKNAEKIFKDQDVRLLLLTSNKIKEEGKKLHDSIMNGEVDLVVGTHALIQEKVRFKKLGLAIIDEQHRFGVKQRRRLMSGSIKSDTLVMTATPIPRSLALTSLGNLDLSIIDRLPSGRKPVDTVLTTDRKRDEVYEFIRKQLKRGNQVYVVYPIIESTEKNDLRAAADMAEHLKNEIFKTYSVALLHGRMNGEEKERIMREFVSGRINLLVTTTVIEVGIDVPNATVMLIEHSERFGLSQLHQLRGRIGRGKQKSYCILMINPPGSAEPDKLKLTNEAKERLKIMRDSNDGFVISQKDLEIRGPGEFFGSRQSGIPRFKIADLTMDWEILLQAFNDAKWYFNLPDIEKSPDYERYVEILRKWWKTEGPDISS